MCARGSIPIPQEIRVEGPLALNSLKGESQHAAPERERAELVLDQRSTVAQPLGNVSATLAQLWLLAISGI